MSSAYKLPLHHSITRDALSCCLGVRVDYSQFLAANCARVQRVGLKVDPGASLEVISILGPFSINLSRSSTVNVIISYKLRIIDRNVFVSNTVRIDR